MKKVASLILSFTICISLCIPASADEGKAASMSTNEAIISEFLSNTNSDNFGGIFYDDDKNLVCCVKEGSDFSTLASPMTTEANVIFRTVKYSLSELESYKDLLTPYMKEYGIIYLDADETTNKVKIKTTKITEELKAHVSSIVDLADCELVEVSESAKFTSTLKMVDSDYIEDIAPSAESRASTIIYPGTKILIGSSSSYAVCSAGPRISSSKFYTCGHFKTEFLSSTQNVYLNSTTLSANLIGKTGSVVFGSSGDYSTVTLSGNATLPSSNKTVTGKTYTYGSVYVGDAVEMHGTMSGISYGEVTATNINAEFEDGTIVKNMYEADYTCKSGDSGGGVFTTTSNSSCICPGVQSGGGDEKNGIYYTSVFSMVPQY